MDEQVEPVRTTSVNEASALIVEERGFISRYISRYLPVETYHPKQVTDSRLRAIVSKLRFGNYAYVFIQLPFSAKSLANGSCQKTYTELGEWMRISRDSGTPAVMYGIRSRKWLEPGLHALDKAKGIFETQVRLCALKVKFDLSSAQPSEFAYHAKSIVKIASRL